MKTRLDEELKAKKAKLNSDAESTMKNLLEKHDALVAKVEMLVALLEANSSDFPGVDFLGELEANSVSID